MTGLSGLTDLLRASEGAHGAGTGAGALSLSVSGMSSSSPGAGPSAGRLRDLGLNLNLDDLDDVLLMLRDGSDDDDDEDGLPPLPSGPGRARRGDEPGTSTTTTSGLTSGTSLRELVARGERSPPGARGGARERSHVKVPRGGHGRPLVVGRGAGLFCSAVCHAGLCARQAPALLAAS